MILPGIVPSKQASIRLCKLVPGKTQSVLGDLQVGYVCDEAYSCLPLPEIKTSIRAEPVIMNIPKLFEKIAKGINPPKNRQNVKL